jgi:hypothetical protein
MCSSHVPTRVSKLLSMATTTSTRQPVQPLFFSHFTRSKLRPPAVQVLQLQVQTECLWLCSLCICHFLYCFRTSFFHSLDRSWLPLVLQIYLRPPEWFAYCQSSGSTATVGHTHNSSVLLRGKAMQMMLITDNQAALRHLFFMRQSHIWDRLSFHHGKDHINRHHRELCQLLTN